MTEKEIRTPIGYLELPDGPIFVNWEEPLILKPFDPISVRGQFIVQRNAEGEVITSDSEKGGKILHDQINYLTSIVIRYIEHHRIPGRINLYFEMVTLKWDYKIVCKAYKKD